MISKIRNYQTFKKFDYLFDWVLRVLRVWHAPCIKEASSCGCSVVIHVSVAYSAAHCVKWIKSKPNDEDYEKRCFYAVKKGTENLRKCQRTAQLRQQKLGEGVINVLKNIKTEQLRCVTYAENSFDDKSYGYEYDPITKPF